MKHRFHPEAEAEFLDSISYYERCQEGLGGRFLETVEAAVAKVVAQPRRWRVFDGDVRRCLTRVFPFALLYTIEPGYVLIVAIMHCSREPGYWKHRLGSSLDGGRQP